MSWHQKAWWFHAAWLSGLHFKALPSPAGLEISWAQTARQWLSNCVCSAATEEPGEEGKWKFSYLNLSVNFIFLLCFSKPLMIGTNVGAFWVVTSVPFCTSGWVLQSGERAALYSVVEQLLRGTSWCIFSKHLSGMSGLFESSSLQKTSCRAGRDFVYFHNWFWMTNMSLNVLSELFGIQTFFICLPKFWPFQFSRDHVNDGITALVILV